MIRAIIFDLGGVVVVQPTDLWSVIFEELHRAFGIDAAVFHSHLKGCLAELQTGKRTLYAFYQQVLREVNRTDRDPQELVNKHLEVYGEGFSRKYNQALLHLISLLRTNYRVACFTNTEIEIVEFVRKKGLYEHFDQAFISTELGFRKPETKAYEAVCKQLGIAPNEAVFIDDVEENVVAAQHFGMHGILYKDSMQLQGALASILALCDRHL